MTDALHLTPREVAQVEAALDEPTRPPEPTPEQLERLSRTPARPWNPPPALTSAELLAAAAIVAAEADERGIRHWTDLADRLTREAARVAVREDENDEQ